MNEKKMEFSVEEINPGEKIQSLNIYYCSEFSNEDI